MSGQELVLEVVDQIKKADDPEEINTASHRLMHLLETKQITERDITDVQDDLDASMEKAKERVASVVPLLAFGQLALVPPDPPEDWPVLPPRRGPAAERLMAAVLLLEHANEIVKASEDVVLDSIDDLRRPDFSSSPEVFALGTELLRTAGYYTLDARDAHAALASEPPDQELFPRSRIDVSGSSFTLPATTDPSTS